MTNSNPLDLLLSYERRAYLDVINTASEDAHQSYWSGLPFQVGSLYMAVADQNVLALLPVPPITVVPGTQHWVKGVANVHGELLPIIDFGYFLFQQATPVNKNTRVLVIQYLEIQSGLMVNHVYGRRRFATDLMTAQPANDQLTDNLQSIIGKTFTDTENQQTCHTLVIEKLINQTNFMQGAIQ